MAPGDEVFIKINGERKYLWRAVDADGAVLGILVQSRRDKAAARRFFRRLLKTTRVAPRVVVTDRLRSYGAAHREVMPSVEHRSRQGLNNRAENSHQPTRQRERATTSRALHLFLLVKKHMATPTSTINPTVNKSADCPSRSNGGAEKYHITSASSFC